MIQYYMDIIFEWDSNKAESNLRKHGISFDEAALVFDDPLAISKHDRIDGGERRWQTIGMIHGCLVLLVAHTIRVSDETEIVRIISARPADRTERRNYEHG